MLRANWARVPEAGSGVPGSRCLLVDWDFYLDEAARGRGIDGCDDLGHAGLDEGPATFSEYHEGYSAGSEILLIAKIFVCCPKDFKACGFGFIQKVSVFSS